MNISSLVIPEMDLHDSSAPNNTPSFYLITTSDGNFIRGREGIIFGHIPLFLSQHISGEIFLGRENGKIWYVSSINPNVKLPTDYQKIGIRELYGSITDSLLGIACRAVQLVRFDSLNKFCGYCGNRNIMKADEIAKVCSSCGRIVFPRLSPAIIVRITDGDRILLSRSPNFTSGMYSIQAGFVEPGESLEAAAKREVREEVGVTIKNLKYFASQPWPFPDSLMLGFTSEYDGGEIRPDGVEIEDVNWFYPENLPVLPSPISISRMMIQDWIDKYLS